MQIQNYNNLSFKGLKCYPNYEEVQYVIATKMSGNGFYKTMDLIDSLAQKKAHAIFYLAGDLQNPKIYSEIGGKTFKENFFNSPYRVAKKTVKLANKLDQNA